jgi:L-rhamnose-H+ transport protein
MAANPLLGVFYHSVGGFAAGSFYLPYKKVRNWAWEVYWMVGGVFSWIIAPWAFAWAIARANGVDLLPIVTEALRDHPQAMIWAYVLGAMWGVGGLTFGLTMRYLGMSLGMAVALGFCAIFGTLIPPLLGMTVKLGWFGSLAAYLPPIYDQDFRDLLRDNAGQVNVSGLVTLGGLLVCVLGILLCGKAGMIKEREQPEAAKKAAIAEFSFSKGMWVAVFSGIMSACMAFAISSGAPMGAIAHRHGISEVLQNTPVLIVVLAGGFTTNFIWCMILSRMNRSFGHYTNARGASLPANYIFSALAGVTWYLQFFFYSMGNTRMGEYEFSSWTLHMATIIIFSNMWGLVLHEWRGVSQRVQRLIFSGITVLILSTLVVGYGALLKERSKPVAQATMTQPHEAGQPASAHP